MIEIHKPITNIPSNSNLGYSTSKYISYDDLYLAKGSSHKKDVQLFTGNINLYGVKFNFIIWNDETDPFNYYHEINYLGNLIVNDISDQFTVNKLRKNIEQFINKYINWGETVSFITKQIDFLKSQAWLEGQADKQSEIRLALGIKVY